MRIISGTARGKKLAGFSGERIRPTADRVREALFSILVSRIGSFHGLRVLDLFAGTGALALEAISRGAREAVLIEAHPDSLKIIRGNIAACRMEAYARLVRGELPAVLDSLVGQTSFGLIFVDPPYGQELVPPVLAAVDRLGLLTAEGVVVAETAVCDSLPTQVGQLHQTGRRNYGATAVTFYERIDPSA